MFTAIFATLALLSCSSGTNDTDVQSGPPQYDGFEYYKKSAQLDIGYVFIGEKALEISDGTNTVAVEGLFDEGFAVYNSEVYAYNTALCELWRISADGSYEIAVSSDTFAVSEEALMPYGEEETYRTMAGAYEKYIYFNENYNPAYGFAFVLDTETGSYTMTQLEAAELCHGVNGKIYYMPSRGRYFTDTIYECDVTLTEKKVLITDVLHFGFVGGTIYYVHVPDDLYDIDTPAYAKGYQFENYSAFELGGVTTHKTVFADFAFANLGVLKGTDTHVALLNNYFNGELVVEAVNCSLRDGCIFTQNYIPDSTSMECKYINAEKTYTFLCDMTVMYRLHFENGTVYYTDDEGNRVYPETVITDTVFDTETKTAIAKYGLGE